VISLADFVNGRMSLDFLELLADGLQVSVPSDVPGETRLHVWDPREDIHVVKEALCGGKVVDEYECATISGYGPANIIPVLQSIYCSIDRRANAAADYEWCVITRLPRVGPRALRPLEAEIAVVEF
jgi:hypothetical protein